MHRAYLKVNSDRRITSIQRLAGKEADHWPTFQRLIVALFSFSFRLSSHHFDSCLLSICLVILVFSFHLSSHISPTTTMLWMQCTAHTLISCIFCVFCTSCILHPASSSRFAPAVTVLPLILRGNTSSEARCCALPCGCSRMQIEAQTPVGLTLRSA